MLFNPANKAIGSVPAASSSSAEEALTLSFIPLARVRLPFVFSSSIFVSSPFLLSLFLSLSRPSFSAADSDARLSRRFLKQSALVNNVIPSSLFRPPSYSVLQLTCWLLLLGQLFLLLATNVFPAAAVLDIHLAWANGIIL